MQKKRIDTTNLEKLVAAFSYCSYLIWDIWKYMYIFLHERTWTNMYAYVCMYMCACACKFNNKIHKRKVKTALTTGIFESFCSRIPNRFDSALGNDLRVDLTIFSTFRKKPSDSLPVANLKNITTFTL